MSLNQQAASGKGLSELWRRLRFVLFAIIIYLCTKISLYKYVAININKQLFKKTNQLCLSCSKLPVFTANPCSNL